MRAGECPPTHTHTGFAFGLNRELQVKEQQQFHFETAELNLGFVRSEEKSNRLGWSHHGNHSTQALLLHRWACEVSAR